jgi:ubiquinone/menaquinone biosynthesis C-methylase UbiE
MIPSRRVFEDHAVDYDQWFDDHDDTYLAQLRMLRAAVPDCGDGLEVGLGSGRFAVSLGIRYGIDPSPALIQMAKRKGVEVVIGEGEHLPYSDCSFDYILMITVVCYLDDPLTVFREVCRVLVSEGNLIVGFIEKDGEIATLYRNEKTKGRFLQYARFLTENEIIRFFYDAGFMEVSIISRSRGFCVMIGQREGNE